MNRFSDYFVICGLDLNVGLEPDNYPDEAVNVSPLERSYKGKVLAHYPDSVASNPFDSAAVCMMCLPNGLKFRTQKHSVTHTPNFHSFLITKESGRRCYGFSMVFYEEVRNRDICTAMQTLQAMYVAEQAAFTSVPTSQSRSLPRHFKLNPHNTGAAAAFYHYDITKDKLFVSKCIALICECAYMHAAKMFLENLLRCSKRMNATSAMSLESYVFNAIFEIQLPAPGKSLLVHLPPAEPMLPPASTVIIRPDPCELPLLDYPLRLMFMWLGVDVVLQLYTCLLLENQILLRSGDCQKLMVVAEGIAALLFPFAWPHVYAPVLPANLHHFLDAPVPFVMGIHTPPDYHHLLYYNTPAFKLASETTLCFVDIDKCKVQLPEDMVHLPHLEAFSAELTATLDKFGVVPSGCNTKDREPMRKSSLNGVLSTTLPSPSTVNSRRKFSLQLLQHETLSDLNDKRPPSPPGSARTEALQRIADIVRKTGVPLDSAKNDKRVRAFEDAYLRDLRFNNTIREIFLNRFVHIFQSYENFVIASSNVVDQSQDVQCVQNFDKASFLSDQPDHDRPFLCRFLESQMFATLIDHKIEAQSSVIYRKCDQSTGIGWNLSIFDDRIRRLKKRYGDNCMRSLCTYEPCTTYVDTQNSLERKFLNPDFEAPMPTEMLSSNLINDADIRKNLVNTTRQFPILDHSTLNRRPIHNKGSIPRAKTYTRPPVPPHSSKIQTEISNVSIITQQPQQLIEKLLKDCKIRTKRMLMAKLGAEGVNLTNTTTDRQQHNSIHDTHVIEENTLVGSLCDFLDRVWAHGLQRKRSKSAFWSHLLTYHERTLTDGSAMVEQLNLNHDENANSDDPFVLKPLADTLAFDIRNVLDMGEVKTGIGMTRAFVRLALERKHLSKHVRVLFNDQASLHILYKKTAFLRCDDEIKEQFLYHLLSLNAVDYFCFTNTYPTATIPYRIVIVPHRRSGSTSANAWTVLSGTLSETKKIAVPKESLNFVHRNQNIGVPTTLRIGHDNSGLYAKWMIDYVLVRNEVTGHTYNFPCGRWLGRGVDDGSTERLLVALPVSKRAQTQPPAEHTQSNSSLDRLNVMMGNSGSLRSQSPCRAITTLKPSQIQSLLGDCVNRIVKWHYKRSSERNTTLTALLCGEGGLVHCLEHVFSFGFKSTRMFVSKNYLWDYFVKVKDQFEGDLMDDGGSQRSLSVERAKQKVSAVWRCYCHLIEEILSSSQSLGKDGKFQLFICLSVREHLLHRMLVPMSMCKVTTEMYEENSFLRNRGLLTFLRQILLPLDDINVVLENSVTQGISSPHV